MTKERENIFVIGEVWSIYLIECECVYVITFCRSFQTSALALGLRNK